MMIGRRSSDQHLYASRPLILKCHIVSITYRHLPRLQALSASSSRLPDASSISATSPKATGLRYFILQASLAPRNKHFSPQLIKLPPFPQHYRFTPIHLRCFHLYFHFSRDSTHILKHRLPPPTLPQARRHSTSLLLLQYCCLRFSFRIPL